MPTTLRCLGIQTLEIFLLLEELSPQMRSAASRIVTGGGLVLELLSLFQRPSVHVLTPFRLQRLQRRIELEAQLCYLPFQLVSSGFG